MKYRIHRLLAEQIRLHCEDRLPLRLQSRWFSWGNVYPDCTHRRLQLHEAASAGPMLGRMIVRRCRWGIRGDRTLSRFASLRLGIIAHYVCDFMCYVHTSRFTGTLKEHREYERVQGALEGSRELTRSLHAFHGARDGEELAALLSLALEERGADTFSPEEDLDYAASAAAELIVTMLRICMEREEAASWWNHLPLMRRRYLARVS